MAKNPLNRFAPFIGVWNTTGDVFATDQSPATTLSATDTYRWLPGRHFVIHDVDARFGVEATRSMEVIGYDKTLKRYISRSYDDRGGSEEFALTLNGRRWRILGETVRFDGRFNATRDALSGLWEIKATSGWRPWIKITLSRA